MYYLLIDGWTTDDLQYLWKRKDPVQIVENLHLPRFTLEKYISDYCNIKTNTGKTDILKKLCEYIGVSRKKLCFCYIESNTS